MEVLNKKFIELLELDIPAIFLNKKIDKEGEVELQIKGDNHLTITLLMYNNILNIYLGDEQYHLVDDLIIKNVKKEYDKFKKILENKIVKEVLYTKNNDKPKRVIFSINGERILNIKNYNFFMFRKMYSRFNNYDSWI